MIRVQDRSAAGLVARSSMLIYLLIPLVLTGAGCTDRALVDGADTYRITVTSSFAHGRHEVSMDVVGDRFTFTTAPDQRIVTEINGEEQSFLVGLSVAGSGVIDGTYAHLTIDSFTFGQVSFEETASGVILPQYRRKVLSTNLVVEIGEATVVGGVTGSDETSSISILVEQRER